MAQATVKTEQIADGAITAAKIADGAIVAAELASNSVTTAKIADDAVTSAKLDTNIAIAGTLDVAGAVVFNEGSADVDFRVESNGNANMIFVDGGNDKVGIGVGAPTAKLSLPAQASGDSGIARFAIESGVDSNDFTISQYEDGTGTYTLIGQNISLNSGGNVTVLDSAHKTAGVLFDGRGNGQLQFYTGAANASSSKMTVASDGVITTGGDLIVGADVQLANGRGISFASTTPDGTSVASELLDDYEEGTWTPAFEGTSTSVTVHSAKYTRIGRIVHVTCYFSGMTASNNGSMQKVTGLPFDHTASTYAALSLGYCGTVNLNDALPIITSNYIYFHQNDGNSAVLTRADFYSRAGGVFPLLMSGVYMTDE